jgi:hypothetical protein
LLQLSVSTLASVVYFEIDDIVNFDTFNLLNLAGEDLWSSGVHVKKTGRILIRGLYKPKHWR